MGKRWTLVAHPDYFRSLRTIPNPDERYQLVTAIWERLAESDTPTKDAEPVPEVKGQYEIQLLGHIVSYEIVEKRNEIKLLVVE